MGTLLAEGGCVVRRLISKFLHSRHAQGLLLLTCPATQYSDGLRHGLNETAQEATCAICGQSHLTETGTVRGESSVPSHCNWILHFVLCQLPKGQP